MPVIRNLVGLDQREYPEFITETVKRGPLVVSVTERGTIDSLRSATLENTVEGSTTIISIVPEGTRVTPGEVVCELDSSALVDEHKQQQIVVTQTLAEVKKAEENVAIQMRQNESDIAAAKLAQSLAALDYDKYVGKNGEFEQLVEELEGQITLAEEELKRAEQAYEYSKRIAKKGYRSQDDLDADLLAVTKARINRNVAQSKLEVLREYTYQRTTKELVEQKAESVRELDRVKRQGVAALAQFEAQLAANRLTYDVEVAKLEKLARQIEACKLRAPQEGVVVYANQRSRRSEPTVIEEGATVRERQTIIKLPDLSELKVDARIHESKISKVRVGQRVIVRADAVPNITFSGTVEQISSVPVPGNWPNYDLKEYESLITLTDYSPEMNLLKPGLTAGIEIIVEQRDNVLQAPVQSIVSIGQQHFAYVVTASGPLRRDIRIGQSNNKAVEILDGLEEGERVIMNPRTHFSEEISDLQSELDKKSKKKQAERRGGSTGDGDASGTGNKPDSDDSGQGGRPDTGAPAEEPLAFLKQHDKNSDRKLTRDELPPAMQQRFVTMDRNSDGSLSLPELSAIMKQAADGKPQAEAAAAAAGESTGGSQGQGE